MTKKIMVADPGHDEGSRTVETLCAVQEGTLVVQDVVNNKDISPDLNRGVILAQDKPGNPLLESIKAFKHQKILESGLQQRRDGEAAVDKEMPGRSLADILKTFRNRGSTEIKFTKEDWDNRKPQTEEDRKEMEQLGYEMGQETQMLYLNSMKGLGEDRSIEILPADKTALISGESLKSKDAEVQDLMEEPKPAYSALGSLIGMALGGMLGSVAGGFRRNGGTGPLSEKSSERLVEGTFRLGVPHYCCERESSKAWKRRIKKEQQRIIHRDRRFRDRTRKLKKLMEQQIGSLKFIFQGPPFGDINPGIAMERRYAFPDAPNRMIEHIRNNALDFLGLQQ